MTASVLPQVPAFGPALADAAAAARAAGPVQLPPDLLAVAATLTPEMLTPDLVAGLAQTFGLVPDSSAASPEISPGNGGQHTRMAAVNTILAAAPPRLREQLLIEFVSLLQQPPRG